eukprot:6940637-Heterocapsa_arctica.AAC.1
MTTPNRSLGKSKSKVAPPRAGPTTTSSSGREAKGWRIRPCRWCGGRHMDKDCTKATAMAGAGGGKSISTTAPITRPSDSSKGKGKNQMTGSAMRKIT